MPLFAFTLFSFEIDNTRSLHEDTDYLSWTLSVMPASGQVTTQTKVKSMGNINNGTHLVDLSFDNVSLNPADTVVLNYLIVNAGSSGRVQVETTLETVGPLLVTAGPGLGVPQLQSAMQALQEWLPNELRSVLIARCDGPVAAEQSTFTGTELISILSGGEFKQTTIHPGIDSAAGCGDNSIYEVNWHIQMVGA